MQSTSWETLDWKKHKLESRLKGRNINNLRYADDITLMAESKEELKSLLMKVKKESEKVGLKLNIQKTKIMASGPITSWQMDGKQWLTLFFWAAKSLQMVIVAMKLKDAYSLEGKLWPTSMKLLSCVQLFATPWTIAHQIPPSMGFSRQEHWGGLPFPSPGDLPDPGIELRSPTLQADALPSEPPWPT